MPEIAVPSSVAVDTVVRTSTWLSTALPLVVWLNPSWCARPATACRASRRPERRVSVDHDQSPVTSTDAIRALSAKWATISPLKRPISSCTTSSTTQWSCCV